MEFPGPERLHGQVVTVGGMIYALREQALAMDWSTALPGRRVTPRVSVAGGALTFLVMLIGAGCRQTTRDRRRSRIQVSSCPCLEDHLLDPVARLHILERIAEATEGIGGKALQENGDLLLEAFDVDVGLEAAKR